LPVVKKKEKERSVHRGREGGEGEEGRQRATMESESARFPAEEKRKKSCQGRERKCFTLSEGRDAFARGKKKKKKRKRTSGRGIHQH